MVRYFIVVFFLCYASIAYSQNVDSANANYLEDQFYLNLSYNILSKRPDTISLKGLSNGISFGYIKDIPLNQARNFGLGIGLGYGRNTFYQNLKIFEENGMTVFQSLGDTSFDRNKFSMHAIEIPFEIRWRTSTAKLYNFWRIYSGIKFSYVFASNAKLKQNGTTKINGINELNKFQYGLTLSAGYGTWNVNVYYGLKNLFSDAFLQATNEPLNVTDIRVGLIFYIF